MDNTKHDASISTGRSTVIVNLHGMRRNTIWHVLKLDKRILFDALSNPDYILDRVQLVSSNPLDVEFKLQCFDTRIIISFDYRLVKYLGTTDYITVACNIKRIMESGHGFEVLDGGSENTIRVRFLDTDELTDSSQVEYY